MNRRLLLSSAVIAACAAPSLTGCTAADRVIDLFGPAPDPVLVQLAAQAQAEGRSEHADALFAEVARLCGTHADGTTPRSCEVDRAAAQAALSTAPAPAPLEANVPAESRALLVAQAIDVAAAQPLPAGQDVPADVVPPTGATEDQAKELLEWEYEVIWGLDFARAFAAPEQESRIDGLLTEHEKVALALANALGAAAPSPAVGYHSAALPADAASATAFVDSLLGASDRRWAAAAGKAAAGPWQDWVIATAAALRN